MKGQTKCWKELNFSFPFPNLQDFHCIDSQFFLQKNKDFAIQYMLIYKNVPHPKFPALWALKPSSSKLNKIICPEFQEGNPLPGSIKSNN
jgi:hypothetical protein